MCISYTDLLKGQDLTVRFYDHDSKFVAGVICNLLISYTSIKWSRKYLCLECHLHDRPMKYCQVFIISGIARLFLIPGGE